MPQKLSIFDLDLVRFELLYPQAFAFGYLHFQGFARRLGRHGDCRCKGCECGEKERAVAIEHRLSRWCGWTQ